MLLPAKGYSFRKTSLESGIQKFPVSLNKAFLFWYIKIAGGNENLNEDFSANFSKISAHNLLANAADLLFKKFVSTPYFSWKILVPQNLQMPPYSHITHFNALDFQRFSCKYGLFRHLFNLMLSRPTSLSITMMFGSCLCLCLCCFSQLECLLFLTCPSILPSVTLSFSEVGSLIYAFSESHTTSSLTGYTDLKPSAHTVPAI